MYEEFRALKQLERSPVDRLEWLLNTAHSPADTATNWHDKVAIHAGVFAYRVTSTGLVSRAGKLRRADVYSLLFSINKGLTMLASGQNWTIELPPMSFTLSP